MHTSARPNLPAPREAYAKRGEGARPKGRAGGVSPLGSYFARGYEAQRVPFARPPGRERTVTYLNGLLCHLSIRFGHRETPPGRLRRPPSPRYRAVEGESTHA